MLKHMAAKTCCWLFTEKMFMKSRIMNIKKENIKKLNYEEIFFVVKTRCLKVQEHLYLFSIHF